MFGHDGSTGVRIPGRFRLYTGDPSDRYRIGGTGAHLHLGDLGISGHLPRLAERTSGAVRCGLVCAAREHRAHGAGFLSALAAFSH